MQHLRSFTVPPPELLFDLARSQLGRGPGVANGGRGQGTTPNAGPQVSCCDAGVCGDRVRVCVGTGLGVCGNRVRCVWGQS